MCSFSRVFAPLPRTSRADNHLNLLFVWFDVYLPIITASGTALTGCGQPFPRRHQLFFFFSLRLIMLAQTSQEICPNLLLPSFPNGEMVSRSFPNLAGFSGSSRGILPWHPVHLLFATTEWPVPLFSKGSSVV